MKHEWLFWLIVMPFPCIMTVVILWAFISDARERKKNQ